MDTLMESISSHPSEKTIIFCQYKGEMDHIETILNRETFRIDGSVNKDERHARLKLFEKSSPGSVLVIQIKCGGQGLNIQCATRVYIMSPSWNPSTELQAIGRCHRSGQRNEVFVKKFVYSDTIKYRSVDLAMMSLQGHKSMLCAEVLNDKSIEFQIPTKQEKSIDAIRKIFR
jgi:Superfamily II DNA/RNA helicases, SNF2 family